MSDPNDSVAVAFFGEILAIDQLARHKVAKALPKGMELSHLTVLNHLARTHDEKTPAQLARSFHLTRGAMTNTLHKLEAAGYVHVRPDWDDARRKLVSISPAGRDARERAFATITPIINDAVAHTGSEELRKMLPILRTLRLSLSEDS